MELYQLEWIYAASIFLLTIIGNIGPLFITAPQWTSRLEAMAGGVFLGAGLAHLLCDANEHLHQAKDIHYPVAPAVAVGTFVLLTLVELFSYSEHDAKEKLEQGNDQNTDVSLISQVSLMDDTEIPIGERRDRKITHFGTSLRNITGATISLYVIMDIHSAIEGLTLGILDKKSSIAIFIAIACHKSVEAFALSLILLNDKPTKVLFWILVIIYCLMSPVAIIVGHSLQRISGQLALGIIASFSAGTFMFVGCHEWSEMFEHKQEWGVCEKVWHILFFVLGLLWMLIVAIFE
ncbi:ZIP Zinc transporter family protein [Histomonas meleagridis]|uniref:ZIP Zinc transporter family protein n=1 Tax=Histomonas meleagridis TaxID=135588 RepID=UPI003559A08E|nr:ZIP Zinc transporter family protein [Histomonas meleagridis]KAH0797678.1 ZIP Zinc transporter family protein [Histomonas meleagridis]